MPTTEKMCAACLKKCHVNIYQIQNLRGLKDEAASAAQFGASCQGACMRHCIERMKSLKHELGKSNEAPAFVKSSPAKLASAVP